MSLSLLIVDHRPTVLAGWKRYLSGSRINLVGETRNIKSTLRAAKEHRPDVALVGALADNEELSLLRRLRKTAPDCRVLMCFTDENPTFCARSLALGADGCICLAISRDELIPMLRTLGKGKSAWTDEQLECFSGVPEPAEHSDIHLTPRERQVIRQLSYGLPNREIAMILDISVETVKEHVAAIRQKLGVNDRTRAAVWAIQQGLD